MIHHIWVTPRATPITRHSDTLWDVPHSHSHRDLIRNASRQRNGWERLWLPKQHRANRGLRPDPKRKRRNGSNSCLVKVWQWILDWRHPRLNWRQKPVHQCEATQWDKTHWAEPEKIKKVKCPNRGSRRDWISPPDIYFWRWTGFNPAPLTKIISVNSCLHQVLSRWCHQFWPCLILWVDVSSVRINFFSVTRTSSDRNMAGIANLPHGWLGCGLCRRELSLWVSSWRGTQPESQPSLSYWCPGIGHKGTPCTDLKTRSLMSRQSWDGDLPLSMCAWSHQGKQLEEIGAPRQLGTSFPTNLINNILDWSASAFWGNGKTKMLLKHTKAAATN